MDIQVISGAIQEREADALIVSLFAGGQPDGATRAVDERLDGAIGELIAGGDFSGKAGQVAVLYPRGALPARRVLIVGLGPRQGFGLEAVRRAALHAARRARALSARRIATILHGAGDPNVEAAAQAVAEGTLLGLYEYRGQRSAPAAANLETMELVVPHPQDVPAAQRGVDAGQTIAAGVALARDLVNLPPNICTPTYLAEAAGEAARHAGLRLEVLERTQMEALKMGALLAVAQGSDTPPRFIILEHNGPHTAEMETLVLVGKGITFDTGGYTLKTMEGMANMKSDMAGGAAVIGALQAIGTLGLPLHVVGLVPAADNMISGRAFRPQEVVTASNGVTIEIISTDAEGRLLLADALVYAGRFDPRAVVDIATLTGSCVTALGEGVAAGLFSSDDGLRDRLLAAAAATSERLWPLPLFPEYETAIESKVADLQNGGGRNSGVGASATFLKHFVTCPAWAHIDMAGMALGSKDNPYVTEKSATGFGVRLLTALAREMASKRA